MMSELYKYGEFGRKSDDFKIEKAVIEIYQILKKDLNVVDCDDIQCDNEDCVLFMAVKQYIKYNNLKING